MIDWNPLHGFEFGNDFLVAARDHNTSVANRMSYYLGLTGPSMVLDTACSTTLAAANLGLAYARNPAKEMNKYLVTGSMCILDVGPYIGMSAAHMLGRRGRCLSFDDSGDGYARGESCFGSFFRVTDDLEDIETRFGAQVGGYVNQDGRSASLTAPNGPSQQLCIKGSFKDARIEVVDEAATENHGTGTALGDPIECGSLRAIFGDRARTLAVCTTKPNSGHTEIVAGIISIMKIIQAMYHQTIAPNIHLRSLNANIDTQGFACMFSTELILSNYTESYMGANGFGFGGTNARAEVWGRARCGVSSTEKRRFQLEKTDFVAVVCPRCMGAMCWMCGQAVSAGGTCGKHHCSSVRQRFDCYGQCSNCYDGEYAYAHVCGGGAGQSDGKLFILGTWNTWSKFEEMSQISPNRFERLVTLGETSVEQFHIVLNKDRNQRIHPAVDAASPNIRILGPDKELNNWLLDGRTSGKLPGTVYRITFTWDDHRSITWEPVFVSPENPLPKMRRTYSVVVDSVWRFLAMTPSEEDAETWDAILRIGPKKEVEFQFACDNDMSQLIYPARARARNVGIPIRGPDSAGARKKWLVCGDDGDILNIHLQVKPCRIEMTVDLSSCSKKVHRSKWSTDGSLTDEYFVMGSVTGGAFIRMVPIEESPHIHKLDLQLRDLYHGSAFQIVVNEDWEEVFYPMIDKAKPGESIVIGPNASGQGSSWSLDAFTDSEVEVTLNLLAEDKRHVVTCRSKCT